MLTTTLSGSYGFPLCLYGITQHLALSREMTEHGERRKEMTTTMMMKKKKRRRSSEGENESTHANQEIESERWLQEGQEAKDVVLLLQDLGWCSFSHIAKAA
ncbi:PREDICTED: uncharacterized protein LOC104799488 [Tarenaya hassleriana]|uniref:uncharacterized protein LOC104799488 n=1 Tax=Tarenaya hassleriana TaxID=28532 RepID=UPI00053C5A3A|nr:PREDICTED: uncharacterized protein LOC104799488 [Tarenaya hassleriana]